MTNWSNFPMKLTSTSRSTAVAGVPPGVSTKIHVRQRLLRITASYKPSVLEKLGICRGTLTRHRNFVKNNEHIDSAQYGQETCPQEEEHSLMWTLIGYGITWTVQRSYGQVLPFLSVYPVIFEFSSKTRDLLRKGDLQDIQRMFCSGSIHPSLRNRHGDSLLHVS